MSRDPQDGALDVVELTAQRWRHIVRRHPELAAWRTEVLLTVAFPHSVMPDPDAGRMRFYRAGVGPSRWLRVIVDFNLRPAIIVTAHGYRKEHPA